MPSDRVAGKIKQTSLLPSLKGLQGLHNASQRTLSTECTHSVIGYKTYTTKICKLESMKMLIF